MGHCWAQKSKRLIDDFAVISWTSPTAHILTHAGYSRGMETSTGRKGRECESRKMNTSLKIRSLRCLVLSISIVAVLQPGKM